MKQCERACSIVVGCDDCDYRSMGIRKRRSRRELFLERMEGLIPWARLEARIRPHCPRAGNGRRPCPLETMLRVHCVRLF